MMKSLQDYDAAVAELARLRKQNAILAARAAELEAEAKTNSAFYALTVCQRNLAWRQFAKAEAERDSLRAWREKVLSQRVSVFGLTTFLNEIEREEWADEVARLLSAIESKPGGEE